MSVLLICKPMSQQFARNLHPSPWHLQLSMFQIELIGFHVSSLNFASPSTSTLLCSYGRHCLPRIQSLLFSRKTELFWPGLCLKFLVRVGIQNTCWVNAEVFLTLLSPSELTKCVQVKLLNSPLCHRFHNILPHSSPFFYTFKVLFFLVFLSLSISPWTVSHALWAHIAHTSSHHDSFHGNFSHCDSSTGEVSAQCPHKWRSTSLLNEGAL